ncbi:hypothetical protein ACP4OV_007345 [Aristida adscensionis]
MKSAPTKIDAHVRTYALSMTILADVNSPLQRSIEHEIGCLPVTNFSILKLKIQTHRHVFGDLVLQLLRIRTTIQRLKLIFLEDKFKLCSKNCDCDQDSGWRNELICLPDLQVVEIEGFRVKDHEVDFLELLLRSAPMLKKMSIELGNKVLPNNEQWQKLRNIFETNASVEYSVVKKRRL